MNCVDLGSPCGGVDGRAVGIMGRGGEERCVGIGKRSQGIKCG